MSLPSSQDGKDDENVSIVGLWTVTFNSNGQVFDQGYDQWHSDGTEILNDTAPPQPANGAGTICLILSGRLQEDRATILQTRPSWFCF
jgi:hypothetical protein